MSKIRLKQAGALALACMVFAIAEAAEKPQLILKPMGNIRIDIPQGETQTTQYKLSNHGDTTRAMNLKPAPGIIQATDGDNQCNKPAILKPGESCLLTLKLNGTELVNSKVTGPLLCENGANWFDEEIVASSSSIQPEDKEKLSVNVISAGTASLSARIKFPERQTNGNKKETVTRSCFSSMFACSMNLFVNGASATVSLTNTSTTTTALNVQVTSAPAGWDVSSTTCPSIAPGASCDIVFTPSTSNTHPLTGAVQIQGSNTPAINISASILGAGDTYQEALIYLINPGTNTGKLVSSMDVSAASPWNTRANQAVGTDDDNGLQNSQAIAAVYPDPASPAAICLNEPSIPPGSSVWFLPAKNQLIELVEAVMDVCGDPIAVGCVFGVATGFTDYYWSSSETAGLPVTNATAVAFVKIGTVIFTDDPKTTLYRFRCIRDFTG